MLEIAIVTGYVIDFILVLLFIFIFYHIYKINEIQKFILKQLKILVRKGYLRDDDQENH